VYTYTSVLCIVTRFFFHIPNVGYKYGFLISHDGFTLSPVLLLAFSVFENLVGQAIAYAFRGNSNAFPCLLFGDNTSIIEKFHDFIVVFPYLNRSTVPEPKEIIGVLRELCLSDLAVMARHYFITQKFSMN